MPRAHVQPHRAAVFISLVCLLVVAPSTAYAECSFVPPWPRITDAMSSARDIVVGEVVENVDPAELASGDGDTEALRVTTVLRGSRYKVGDLIGTTYLLPNWPWQMAGDGSRAYPSCRYLEALPGERIALAIDALMPAQDLRDSNDAAWHQPPTRYNAMGVLAAREPTDGWGEEREPVTLAELKNLAGLPQTDVLGPSREPSDLNPWPIVVLVGVIGALVLLARPSRDIPRR